MPFYSILRVIQATPPTVAISLLRIVEGSNPTCRYPFDEDVARCAQYADERIRRAWLFQAMDNGRIAPIRDTPTAGYTARGSP